MSLIIKYLKFDIFSEGLSFRAKFSSWVKKHSIPWFNFLGSIET
jgi:hypothetical protein